MLFSFDNYLKLCEEIKNAGDDDDKDNLKYICHKCLEYVNSVHAHQKALEIIRFRYDADEMNRHVIHEVAISNCNVLNRLAAFYGIGKIFTGNVNNRFEVADFCLEVAVKIEGYQEEE